MAFENTNSRLFISGYLEPGKDSLPVQDPDETALIQAIQQITVVEKRLKEIDEHARINPLLIFSRMVNSVQYEFLTTKRDKLYQKRDRIWKRLDENPAKNKKSSIGISPITKPTRMMQVKDKFIKPSIEFMKSLSHSYRDKKVEKMESNPANSQDSIEEIKLYAFRNELEKLQEMKNDLISQYEIDFDYGFWDQEAGLELEQLSRKEESLMEQIEETRFNIESFRVMEKEEQSIKEASRNPENELNEALSEIEVIRHDYSEEREIDRNLSDLNEAFPDSTLNDEVTMEDPQVDEQYNETLNEIEDIRESNDNDRDLEDQFER
jgi:hypothetical protein